MLESYIINQFDELPSTQEFAHTLLTTSQAHHSTVISAFNQTNGYGRQKKQWLGTEGNIAITIILKPQVFHDKLSQLSYVAGNAVRDSIASFTDKNCQLKWVNDILIEDKKVSGILLEKIGDVVLVGIGVNVVRTPGIAEFNGTSLEDLKIHVHMPEVMNTILDNFKTCYNNWREFGFTFNRNKWLENCKGLNDNILVKLSQQEVNGTFKTIDEQGKLIVETSNGSVKIDSGELFFT